MRPDSVRTTASGVAALTGKQPCADVVTYSAAQACTRHGSAIQNAFSIWSVHAVHAVQQRHALTKGVGPSHCHSIAHLHKETVPFHDSVQ